MEILEPLDLSFTDLSLLSSETNTKIATVKSLIENLGPNGPGLITVSGVPHAGCLRKKLLPLARRLALLNADDRKRVLKEQSLGSDVPLKNPNRLVSSFAAQLKYSQDHKSNSIVTTHKDDENEDEQFDFKNLGTSFRELGIIMMDLGLSLARICDRALGDLDLEQSLLDSCSAKGRLIHYHSSCENQSNMWQQWHYDYGIFTILTSPLFISPCHQEETGISELECPSLSGHTYLRIFNRSKNKIQMVNTDAESFIIQVGEAAEILSKGKLCANLHSVSRPEKVGEMSRETFVVFLQPRWDKKFCLGDYPVKGFLSYDQDCEDEHGLRVLGQEIDKIVPPLSSRLKDGMTFAEFSQETTKQYYGVSGLQSKR